MTGTGAYQFLAVSIGYAAFAAALLSCHHDIILGLLALFQHRLCKSEELDTNWFSPANFEKVLEGSGSGTFTSLSWFLSEELSAWQFHIRLLSLAMRELKF